VHVLQRNVWARLGVGFPLWEYVLQHMSARGVCTIWRFAVYKVRAGYFCAGEGRKWEALTPRP
jgi:hypothetical protein